MRLLRLLLGVFAAAGMSNALADDGCSYRQTSPPKDTPKNRLVTYDNWLAVEHLRVGLQAPQRFMPGVVMRSPARSGNWSKSDAPIDLDRQMGIDPDDASEKSLRFLLDSRLYADAIIVLKGEQVVLEHYRAGFAADSARALLQATRPFLTSMLAAAADRGRLLREKSIVRALPDLAREADLRKISVQRLLDGRTGLSWSAEDRRQWLAASGWGSAPARPTSGVRAWLKARKAWPRDGALPVSEIGGPEGELLVGVLENASKKPVSRVLCESVLSAIGAQDEAFWATDASGTELADGLALSLRDLARFGLALLDARARPGGGSVAPKWFAETLASTVTRSDPPPEQLRSLGDDTAWRYRYVSLGRAHQAAIVGPFGNSLLIDFDRKMVVAIFASFPDDYAPLMLRTLRNVWSAIETADRSTGGAR